jgi:hypothetical protein
VSSSRDFGVEQFFRADEFRADDPSPGTPTIELRPRVFLKSDPSW